MTHMNLFIFLINLSIASSTFTSYTEQNIHTSKDKNSIVSFYKERFEKNGNSLEEEKEITNKHAEPSLLNSQDSKFDLEKELQKSKNDHKILCSPNDLSRFGALEKNQKSSIDECSDSTQKSDSSITKVRRQKILRPKQPPPPPPMQNQSDKKNIIKIPPPLPLLPPRIKVINNNKSLGINQLDPKEKSKNESKIIDAQKNPQKSNGLNLISNRLKKTPRKNKTLSLRNLQNIHSVIVEETEYSQSEDETDGTNKKSFLHNPSQSDASGFNADTINKDCLEYASKKAQSNAISTSQDDESKIDHRTLNSNNQFDENPSLPERANKILNNNKTTTETCQTNKKSIFEIYPGKIEIPTGYTVKNEEHIFHPQEEILTEYKDLCHHTKPCVSDQLKNCSIFNPPISKPLHFSKINDSDGIKTSNFSSSIKKSIQYKTLNSIRYLKCLINKKDNIKNKKGLKELNEHKKDIFCPIGDHNAQNYTVSLNNVASGGLESIEKEDYGDDLYSSGSFEDIDEEWSDEFLDSAQNNYQIPCDDTCDVTNRYEFVPQEPIYQNLLDVYRPEVLCDKKDSLTRQNPIPIAGTSYLRTQ